MNGSKNFVLQEVIDELVKPEITLVAPLMKLMYFARSTKNEQLLKFISNELNGYQTYEDLPMYRKPFGTLEVDMQVGYHKHTKELPLVMLDKEFKEIIQRMLLGDGIGTIEKWAADVDAKLGYDQISRPIPIQIIHQIQPSAEKYFRSDAPIHVVGANMKTNASVSIEILNNVRAKLLAFVMDIADEFGYNIDMSTFKQNQEKNNQIINNFMHTEIHNNGDGNVVNTGANANLNATITINKGDIRKLNSELQKLGFEEADIQELNNIIIADKPDFEKKILGKNTNKKILELMGKALNGVGKIATSASGNIIATLVKQYYGMDS